MNEDDKIQHEMYCFYTFSFELIVKRDEEIMTFCSIDVCYVRKDIYNTNLEANCLVVSIRGYEFSFKFGHVELLATYCFNNETPVGLFSSEGRINTLIYILMFKTLCLKTV